MIEQIGPLTGSVHLAGLNGALRAVFPQVLGLSGYGPSRPISIWLESAPSPAEQSTIDTTIAAHDPVFLSVDKNSIRADGVDEAVVTVTTPKTGAAPVTLIVNGVEVAPDEAGQVHISSLDPQTISVSVKDPANRTTDTLTIEAI
jgi:hypothetical protein